MNNIRPQLPKIAVFASGFGSNFQAIIDAIKNGSLMAEIVCLVTDKPESYSVQRAIKEGIDIIAFSAKNYASKADYEKMIAAQPQEKEKRHLYRDRQDKILGGVCSGLAHYFGGQDPLLCRIITLVLAFLSQGIIPFIYVVMWILVEFRPHHFL